MMEVLDYEQAKNFSNYTQGRIRSKYKDTQLEKEKCNTVFVPAEVTATKCFILQVKEATVCERLQLESSVAFGTHYHSFCVSLKVPRRLLYLRATSITLEDSRLEKAVIAERLVNESGLYLLEQLQD